MYQTMTGPGSPTRQSGGNAKIGSTNENSVSFAAIIVLKESARESNGSHP